MDWIKDADMDTTGDDIKVTRVVLADDHPMIRFGIRKLLEKEDDIVVVGEASDGRAALELVEALQPDVLLLDLEMPVLKGYEVAQILQDMGSRVRILVLSAYKDKYYTLQMLQVGVSAFLAKEEAPERVVAAVRQVVQADC
ncbi:MAG: DNA-binding response regulator [Chloroflexota bacterium]|nr:MAG: DNA-binding response regulator [Chloroflexota bacterium]